MDDKDAKVRGQPGFFSPNEVIVCRGAEGAHGAPVAIGVDRDRWPYLLAQRNHRFHRDLNITLRNMGAVGKHAALRSISSADRRKIQLLRTLTRTPIRRSFAECTGLWLASTKIRVHRD